MFTARASDAFGETPSAPSCVWNRDFTDLRNLLDLHSHAKIRRLGFHGGSVSLEQTCYRTGPKLAFSVVNLVLSIPGDGNDVHTWDLAPGGCGLRMRSRVG